jgi:hypothetical protein
MNKLCESAEERDIYCRDRENMEFGLTTDTKLGHRATGV